MHVGCYDAISFTVLPDSASPVSSIHSGTFCTLGRATGIAGPAAGGAAFSAGTADSFFWAWASCTGKDPPEALALPGNSSCRGAARFRLLNPLASKPSAMAKSAARSGLKWLALTGLRPLELALQNLGGIWYPFF